jgi:large subunit ribosomal protein L10
MPKTRVQKAETLERLAGAFQKGKSVMFADYQGMTVAKVTNLRKEMHKAQVEYIVAKKTLIKLAAKQAGHDIDVSTLPGMLAAAFTNEDEMAGAKLIGDAGKDSPIKLVGGIFDGKVVDQTFVVTLSKLPSKNQLLGQLLSVFNGPIGGFVRVLNAYQEKMVGVNVVA